MEGDDCGLEGLIFGEKEALLLQKTYQEL